MSRSKSPSTERYEEAKLYESSNYSYGDDGLFEGEKKIIPANIPHVKKGSRRHKKLKSLGKDFYIIN